MDIFVLLSITEGLPLTILEAMAFSLSVVATSVGGVPEVIKHGECGFLVPPGNHKELSSKIAYLLDCPSLRNKLGYRGRQRVYNEFDASKMIQETINVYYRLLKEPIFRTHLECGATLI